MVRVGYLRKKCPGAKSQAFVQYWAHYRVVGRPSSIGRASAGHKRAIAAILCLSGAAQDQRRPARMQGHRSL